MILVGYSDTSKAYILYSPRINYVIISRDVTIIKEVKEKVQVQILRKEDEIEQSTS